MSASPMTPDQLATWRPEIETPVWGRHPEVTAANAQEVYPGVGDPLSLDFNLVAIEHGSRTLAHRLGLTETLGLDQWPHFAFFASYYGRAFINISTLRELAKWVPNGDPDALDEQLFGRQRPAGAPSWQPETRHKLVRLRSLARVLPVLRGLNTALVMNNAAVEGYLQKLLDADLPSYSDAALMAELDEAYRRNLVTCEIHAACTFLKGNNAFENLRAFLSKLGVDQVDAMVADLCTGLEDVESAKPGRELSRLANQIRAAAPLRGLFGWDNPEAILAMLRKSEDTGVRAFRRQFDSFLRTYGYRGVRELGLATHVWSMRPEAVIGILQSYLLRPETVDHEAQLQAQVHRRQVATSAIAARLSFPHRRRFHGLLKAAHDGISARELAKSEWVRATHAIRLLVREIGRRLQSRAVLASADGIFYLRLTELRDAMAGNPPADLAARISRRKEDTDRSLQVETDERFSGLPVGRLQGTPSAAPATVAETMPAAGGAPAAETVLRGIPVSPGRVTAAARVVRELTDDIEVLPGEVLVCPFTDAAWTPLFFNAAAVVMDLGGPLSHGSTVAREYGLPAVVNVKTGTRDIRDGQQVTVDGSAGEVTIHG